MWIMRLAAPRKSPPEPARVGRRKQPACSLYLAAAVGGVRLLAVVVALSGDLLPATAEADRSAQSDDRLEAPVQASWTRVPIRDWVARATSLAGRPVILDRRVDPEWQVTLTARGESLRAVLEQVAEAAGARVDDLRGSIRIVPTATAGLALAAEQDTAARLARLPARQKNGLTTRQSWQWPAGARPRDLVTAAAAEAGLRIDGLELVPHDHFPAADLPPLSLVERLDLVVAHFDQRILWVADGGLLVGRVVPIDAEIKTDVGRPREARGDTPPPRRRRPHDRSLEVFSLKLEAPLDQAVAAIADRLGLEPAIDERSLIARGIAVQEIVRTTVSNVSREQLLDTMLTPLQLGWRIEAGQLRVFAAVPTVAAPTPADIAAAVAARGALPSVHADRETVRRALEAAELPPEAVTNLFAASDRANRPGMVPSLDSFLFLTSDPAWRALRRQFAEFLELPQITALAPELTTPLAGYAGVVTLPAITTLSLPTAQALAEFGTDDWAAAVEFPGVTQLDPEAASAIANCPALLVFPNLERLSLEAAAGLARHQGIGIVLGGLAAVPDDVAAALAETASLQGLLLPDLMALDSAALARRLTRQDHVFLPKIKLLSPAIAAALRGSDGGELALPGLESLPAEVARQLVGGGYFWLVFGCGKSLSPEVAAILASHPGQLTFTGPEACSPESAAGLAQHIGTLRLPHVQTLSAPLAAALGRHAGPLVFDGLTTLDGPEAAAVARSLSASPGILALPSLRRISAVALETLLLKPGVQLPPLSELEILGPGGGHHEDAISPN